MPYNNLNKNQRIYYSNGKIMSNKLALNLNSNIDNKKFNKKRFFTGIIIPLISILFGTFLIYREFVPEIQKILQDNNNYLSQGNISPVSDSYVNFEQFLSNPSGLNLLSEKAFEQNILETDSKSLSYQGNFYITIPSIGINRLPVEANVDSRNEDSYNLALKDSLAHFKNTGLPISDIKNNIVIYGHSASTNYNPSRSDPEVAFSFLTEMKVGDPIIIEIEGERHEFIMSRSKIVKPDDISVITGTKGKRTLTLFTCYPAGNNTERYVILARES